MSLSIVNAQDVQTNDTLTNTVNVTGNSFDDIQKTIDSSNNGDIIELEGTYTLNKKPINVKKSVTIQGSKKGATLDAQYKESVFLISANKIILKDLTILHSKDSCIQNKDDEKARDLTIINCTFKSNGGNNCWDGGAIFDANDGSLTIINSTFDSNTADFGGAVYSATGDVTVINSTFKNNLGRYGGGAVYFLGNDLKVENSIFNNNRVSGDDSGGAICSRGDSLEVINSIFNKNNAPYGGAIFSSYNAKVRNSTFTSNTAKNKGGAIYSVGELYSEEILLNTFNVYNSTFNDNTADELGNSIYGNVINLEIQDSVFNSKSYDVYVFIGTLKSTNNTLKTFKLENSIKTTLGYDKYSTTHYSYYSFKVSANVGDEYIENVKIKVVVYKGSKTKTFYSYIDFDEPYAYIPLYKLSAGKYKAKIYLESKYYKADPPTIKFSIKKAKTIVSAKKITAKYKKSKMFTVKIKNKATRYAVKNLKIKIKVFTGKKSKSYTVKTNKKGVAKFNTKKLKRGTHNVVISSGSKNYIVSKKSTIRIY